MHRLRRALPGPFALVTLLAFGCQNAYYDTLGTFGVEKRKILRDLIADWRGDQHAVRSQFATTQEAFANASAGGGEDGLEDVYDRLDKQTGKCEGAAKKVSGRSESIQKVGGDVFEEWGEQIAQIQNTRLRKSSQATLDRTSNQFSDLVKAMKDAEGDMDGLLTAFTDRLVFLRTNLTPGALEEARSSSLELGSDRDAMDRAFERALEQADRFTAALPQ